MKKKLLFVLIIIFSFLWVSCVSEDGNTNGGYYEESTFTLFNNVDDSYYNLDINTSSVNYMTYFGYECQGVYTSPNGYGIMYFDANGYLCDNISIAPQTQLYAYYVPKVYDLTLYVNNKVYDVIENISYGDTLIKFNCPTEEGKTFKGWYSGNTQITNEYGSILNGYEKFNKNYFTKDVACLTAVWDDIIINVNFIDDIKGDKIDSVPVIYGNTLDNLIIRDAEYNNFEFLGWSYINDMYNPQYYNNELIKEDTTLYAIYKQFKDINFYYNSEILFTKRVYNDGSVIKVENLQIEEITGYDISGVFTNDSYSGSSKLTTISYQNNTSLYVNLVPIEYTIKLEVPDDLQIDNGLLSYNIEQEITLPTLEKSNNNFLGWCKQSDLSDTPISKIEKGTYGNITLYPKFKYETKTITYIVEEGSLNATSFKVQYNSNYKLDVPSHNTKGFVGWAVLFESDYVLITDKYGNSLNPYLYDDNISVYAKFDTKYYIKSNYDNKFVNINIDDYYYKNENIKLDIIISEGYKLSKITLDGQEVVLSTSLNFTMPSNDVNLKVEIEPNVYKVSYNLNGGILDIISDDVVFGTNYQLPTPDKSGHEFLGWYIEGNKTLYTNTIVWNFTNNINFIAKYKELANRTIYTQEDLQLISEDNEKYIYYLGNDILLDNTFKSVNLDYKSIFDGCGYKISGLNVSLFSNVNGIVKDLQLEANINITEQVTSYGVLSQFVSNESEIFNIVLSGSLVISRAQYTGGLAGSGGADLKIYNIINYADVNLTNGDAAGGIFGAIISKPVFKNNINYGNISSSYATGGLIGYTAYQLTFYDCFNYGTINGKITGGLGGKLDHTIDLSNCANFGQVSSSNNISGSSGFNIIKNATVDITKEEDFELLLKYNQSYIEFNLLTDIVIENINWNSINFTGILNGNGHKITGLITPLFKDISGNVNNLEIDVNITSMNNDALGSLACTMSSYGIVYDIKTTGSIEVSGNINIGGIIGRVLNGSTAKIYNCNNYVNVISTNNTNSAVGGILGSIYGGSLLFENNNNYGNISGQAYVGGIIGGGRDNLTIKNCTNYGKVLGLTAAGILSTTNNCSSIVIDGCESKVYIENGHRYVSYGSVTYLNLSPIEINSIDDFMLLNGSAIEEEFNLNIDIDFKNKEWISCDFAGVLNGNNHKITNLTNSLFNTITGTIINVELEVNILSENDFIGALGKIASGNACFENIITRGEIKSTGNYDVGGIIGSIPINSTEVIISNCSNYVNLDVTNSTNSIGGIVGCIFSDVSNCINYGSINANNNVGGITGYTNKGITFDNCKNYGNILNGSNVGGIIGINDSNSTITIKNCVVEGNIIGEKFIGCGKATYLDMGFVIITSIDDLKKIKYEEQYELMNDIDLTNIDWVPFDFVGTLNGNGHKITGLTTSLFNSVTGIIKNLELDVDIISSGNHIGALAKTTTGSATFENIIARGKIESSGNYDVGGIIGYLAKNSTEVSISNCINYVDLEVSNSTNSIGGIIGAIYSNMSNCINYGTINANNNVGGIVGYTTKNITLENCENYGDILKGNSVGGIIGNNNSGGYISIKKCIVDSTISGNKYVGRGNATYDLDIIEIKTVADFIKIKSNIKEEEYILSNDIDISDIDWTSCNFAGTLKGYNHKINGLTTSLFTNLTGNVSDLELDVNISSTSIIGALSIYAKSNAVIENIVVKGNINTTGTFDVGGIIGNITDNSVTINNCINYSTINCIQNTYSVGGIVGAFSYDGKISNCINYGNISSETKNGAVGGLVGYSGKSLEITNCENYGDIVGISHIGGILGSCASGTATINKCIVICKTNGNKYVGYGNASYDLDSYEIKTIDDLLNMKLNIKEEKYILSSDIDLSDVEWTSFDFRGTLNGQGHKLSNLTLTNKEESLGLFKTLSGSVSNLTLEGFNITSQASLTTTVNAGILCSILTGTIDNVNIMSSKLSVKLANTGGFAGQMTSGTIINSTCGDLENNMTISSDNKASNTGGFIGYYTNGTLSNLNNYSTVECAGQAGGIIGNYQKNGSYSISKLYNYGSITGSDYVGGIAGYFLDSTNHSDYLTELENNGEIIGSNYVGGILGYAKLAGVLELKNTSDITGDSYVGGIFGYCVGLTSNYMIEECTVTGTIKGSKSYAGGIAGKVESMTIKNCSNKDTTLILSKYLIEDNNYYAYIGGFVGYGYKVDNCTNESEITYDFKGNYVGGIAGYSNGSITNCTNNKDITASKASYVGGIVGNLTLSGTFEYSNNTNDGNIKGYDYTSGLFGYIYDNVRTSSGGSYTITINNLTNNGSVEGNDYTSGVISHLYTTGSTQYSGSTTVKVIITELYNYGNISGQAYVGGIIGYGYSHTTSSKLTETISTSEVKGAYYVGGIAGKIEYIVIENASNINSTITASKYYNDNSNHLVYVGGIAGYAYTINNSNNDVELNYDLDGNYIGGIAGYSNGSITNCTNNKDITTSKASYVGGIAGNLTLSGTFEYSNNTNDGNIKGYDYTSGLFGYIYDNVRTSSGGSYTITINNLTNNGSVEGNDYTSGVISHLYTTGSTQYSGSTTVKVIMTELYNYGNISGQAYVGGIIGYGYSHTTSSKLTETISTSEVKGAYYVGGIAGKIEYIVIENASNINSTITASKYYNDNSNHLVYVGGIAGYAYTINNSNNDVELNYDLDGNYVGGIAGYSNGSITNCTNNKDITASKASYVGGIVGNLTLSGTFEYSNNTNDGNIKGYDYTSGLFGYIYDNVRTSSGGSYYANFNNLVNNGSVEGNDYVSGIISYLYFTGSTIYSGTTKVNAYMVDLYNYGNIIGNNYVAGIMGYCYTHRSTSTFADAYSAGTITGNEYTNDIIGYSENITIKENE